MINRSTECNNKVLEVDTHNQHLAACSNKALEVDNENPHAHETDDTCGNCVDLLIFLIQYLNSISK